MGGTSSSRETAMSDADDTAKYSTCATVRSVRRSSARVGLVCECYSVR